MIKSQQTKAFVTFTWTTDVKFRDESNFKSKYFFNICQLKYNVGYSDNVISRVMLTACIDSSLPYSKQ